MLVVLAKIDIDGIMVFGYIAVDIVQAAVADLNVDLALEECSQELDEGRYDRCARSARKTGPAPVAHHPRGDVPEGCTAALVLGIAYSGEYIEELVASAARRKRPHGAQDEEHMKRHQKRACPNPSPIKIRAAKCPSRWRNGQDQVRVRAKHYLPSKAAHVSIQFCVVLLVVAPPEHNTHKVCE
ncbi:hypothetical protein N9L68_03070 [bacterium]|nr:hypothetical protein [bacterium]